MAAESVAGVVGGVEPSDVDVPKVKDIHSSGDASFPKPTFQPSSGNSSVVSRVEFENNSVPSVGKSTECKFTV